MTNRPTPAEQAPTLAVGALPGPIDPSDLAVAISVGQQMLAIYGDTDGRDIYAYMQAHGALAEALRILLRALGGDETASLAVSSGRCPAAHVEDPTPCVGLIAVTVLDAANAGANGCEHHAARLLASLEGGRVYALGTAPESAAIRVFKAAAALRPFPWITDAPRVLPSQLSHDENRAGGEGR
ncbi:hypothetical protein OG194_18915 [Streptomyces sp. NBC_01288]|uniref:hypothetical protein n=1 Tax=Streptomyces sp. NBC_01288 TaxID=2903814 RepID=UPI002E0DDFFF|nr:hypothetical protein OG194_18915 [Streptomyces sp. NBC_01288]